MKKLLLFASLILAAASSCSKPETSLSDTNLKHSVWEDAKIQAMLSEDAKMAICAFNSEYKTVDSLYAPATFSECTSKIMAYQGKHDYILKENSSQCRTIGDSEDLVYYDKEGAPVVHFTQRYLPSADMTTQTLVLFEKGQFKNAYSRSVGGKLASLVKEADFSEYQPMLGEDRVDNYEK